MTVTCFNDNSAGLPHFPVQETYGIVLIVVGSKRIRANQFSQLPGLVGKGSALWPHLVQDNLNAPLGGLPCSFGACEATANDMKRVRHARDVASAARI